MPSRIDQNLIPPVIRQSVDPDILNRAQSIEWSINRDTGEDEHGFLDGSHEDYLSSQNLMPKTHGSIHYGSNIFGTSKSNKLTDWSLDSAASGRDSGYEQTPVSPSLKHHHQQQQQQRSSTRSVSSLSQAANVDLSPLDDFSGGNTTGSLGPMKQHPSGLHPFPIYRVNQEQLQGDVFFEVAPRAKPGERTVHYEKSSRIVNEEELNALGLDPKVFTPNSRTTMDEQEEELIETSVLKGGARELEDIYNATMRNEAGDYFDRQRARSVSPVGNRNPLDLETNEKRTTIFGSVGEIDNREQEFYPYRDAHQGKPLPGDNEYGTWGSRFDEKRQWKLCNGQWVRVGEPKPKAPEPKKEAYMAERIKCKPPKKLGPVKSEPVRHIEPEGSTDSDSDSDNADLDEPIVSSGPRRLPLRCSLDEPPLDNGDRFRRRPPQLVAPRLDLEPPVDLDALRDKYRPKVAEKAPSPDYSPSDDDHDDDTKANSAPTGTILLEPIKPPTPPPEIVVAEPKQPTYVEIKKPLKQPDGEEEKMMEDPNLMWMHMGPAQYGPPFGTLKRRKAREEEWIGPPCELCHKQIEERRCMLAENMKFHCWHFACSFCLKTLKPADFLIAEADRKPYCLNCHKREFPEISLVNLNLEESK